MKIPNYLKKIKKDIENQKSWLTGEDNEKNLKSIRDKALHCIKLYKEEKNRVIERKKEINDLIEFIDKIEKISEK